MSRLYSPLDNEKRDNETLFARNKVVKIKNSVLELKIITLSENRTIHLEEKSDANKDYYES